VVAAGGPTIPGGAAIGTARCGNLAFQHTAQVHRTPCPTSRNIGAFPGDRSRGSRTSIGPKSARILSIHARRCSSVAGGISSTAAFTPPDDTRHPHSCVTASTGIAFRHLGHFIM
jgi:hypothetical protein